jgi:hypothetical protein
VLLWLLLPLAFFSLAASKLPGYILPACRPLAILMGRAADRLVTEAATPERWLAARVVGLVGLVLGALVAIAPAALFREQEPLWRSLIPLAVWALVVTFLVSSRLRIDPAGALRTLRVGAAGLLLLIALAAPPILARRESAGALHPGHGPRGAGLGGLADGMDGRLLLQRRARARGRGRERGDGGRRAGSPARASGTRRRRRLEAMGGLQVRRLASGPRDNSLVRVERAGRDE